MTYSGIRLAKSRVERERADGHASDCVDLCPHAILHEPACRFEQPFHFRAGALFGRFRHLLSPSSHRRIPPRARGTTARLGGAAALNRDTTSRARDDRRDGLG